MEGTRGGPESCDALCPASPSLGQGAGKDEAALSRSCPHPVARLEPSGRSAPGSGTSRSAQPLPSFPNLSHHSRRHPPVWTLSRRDPSLPCKPSSAGRPEAPLPPDRASRPSPGPARVCPRDPRSPAPPLVPSRRPQAAARLASTSSLSTPGGRRGWCPARAPSAVGTRLRRRPGRGLRAQGGAQGVQSRSQAQALAVCLLCPPSRRRRPRRPPDSDAWPVSAPPGTDDREKLRARRPRRLPPRSDECPEPGGPRSARARARCLPGLRTVLAAPSSRGLLPSTHALRDAVPPSPVPVGVTRPARAWGWRRR